MGRSPPESLVFFGYLRVSKELQRDKGHSLATQRQAVSLYMKQLIEQVPAGTPATDGGIFVDVCSAKIPFNRREAGSVLASRLAAGAHVVVNDLSRIFRRAGEALTALEEWQERQQTLHVVREKLDSSSRVGRLFLQFMAIFAQWEREMVSERTREVLAARKRLGKRVGGRAAYGKRYEGVKGHRRQVDDEFELDAMATIARLVDEGYSFDQITLHFQRENIQTRGGRLWTRSRVWRAYRAWTRRQAEGSSASCTSPRAEEPSQ